VIQFYLFFKAGNLHQIGKDFLDISIFHFQLPAGKFIFLYFLSWVMTFLMFFAFPKNQGVKKSCFLILSLSLLFRLAVFSLEPSDDINRYLWEGKLVAEGISPYHSPPLSFKGEDIATEDPYFAKINHPDIPAAYPPMTLFLFAGISKISYSYGAVKATVLLFDMGVIWVFLLLLIRRKTDVRWAVLYGFNPLVIYSFAGQGHFDSIQIFFLLVALLFHDQRKWALMFISLGIGIQIKYVAALGVPFFLNRENLRQAWILGIAVLMPYLPFTGKDIMPLFSGISTFGADYAFNGSIHSLLRAIFQDIDTASRISGSVFFFCLLMLMFMRLSSKLKPIFHDPANGTFYALGALLLLSPTVHFWYIAWILPFAIIKRSFAWIVLTFFMGFYFVVTGIFYHTGKWEFPVIYQVFVWLFFILFFMAEGFYFFKRLFHTQRFKHPVSVSVIIPCLNEEDHIEECILHVRKDNAVKEIIVVDAGSLDKTVFIAQKMGTKIILHRSEPGSGGGRGGQILAGLKGAKGDVVAIVHADTRVGPQIFSKMLKVLANDPGIIGGSVGGVFDSGGIKLKLIE
ncbi:MAG TPA: glycosyltransferase, partial [Desulfobacterales bacterium]|nr:glycosyltransferase [Desulfobacterales bacterium]